MLMEKSPVDLRSGDPEPGDLPVFLPLHSHSEKGIAGFAFKNLLEDSLISFDIPCISVLYIRIAAYVSTQFPAEFFHVGDHQGQSFFHGFTADLEGVGDVI